MIKVNCYTNIDVAKKEEWPMMLPARPMGGDIVCSESGVELQVVRVVFARRAVNTISVELGLIPSRHKSIEDFEKWYEGR